MYYKMSKNKKIVVSFDTSGELMVLWDIRRDELVRTSDRMIYNWYRGNSGFKTPIPFWNENNFEWRYR
jgi:hypothetical protein